MYLCFSLGTATTNSPLSLSSLRAERAGRVNCKSICVDEPAELTGISGVAAGLDDSNSPPSATTAFIVAMGNWTNTGFNRGSQFTCKDTSNWPLDGPPYCSDVW